MSGLAQLPIRWRERAATLERFSPIAANVFRDVADELEASLRSAEVAQSATIDHAKQFVLTQITAAPKQLGTSQLRRLARGRDLSHEAIGHALRALLTSGIIGFERGRRGARLWFVIGTEFYSPWLPARAPAITEAPTDAAVHSAPTTPQEGS